MGGERAFVEAEGVIKGEGGVGGRLKGGGGAGGWGEGVGGQGEGGRA